jgi:hypothetical protein
MAYQDRPVKGLRADPALHLRGHLARRINGIVLDTDGCRSTASAVLR